MSWLTGLLGNECALRVILLPFLFRIRPRTCIEIVAAEVAGGQRLVPMQAGADGVRRRVVGPAHDGKDIPMAGAGGKYTANVLQPGCNAALKTSGLESCKRAGNGPI